MSEALVGTTLDGRYRIVRELGRGGMGAVYEALHTGIDRRLAIKVLHAEVAGEPAVLARFRREAKVTGSLGHPNIIQVTDTGTTPSGAPYLVMELLKGQSLSNMLRVTPQLSLRQALEIMMPVLRALSVVHAKGIIHRDLKPENIFLAEGVGADGTGETVVKVLDFGISKPLDTKLQGSTLTATGTIVGTPHYMSPEQVRGKDIDHRADLYACGVILYEMLTGRVPFNADNFGEMFVAILTGVPEPIRSYRPELPEAIEGVVERAMAREPEERFVSSDELLRALEPLAAASPNADQDATPTREYVIETTPPATLSVAAKETNGAESVPSWNVDPERTTLDETQTTAHETARPRRWGLVVGLAALVAAAIAVRVLIGGGESSETGDTVSGSPVARDAAADTMSVVEGSAAPVVPAAIHPESDDAGVEGAGQVAQDSGPPAAETGSPVEPDGREARAPADAESQGTRRPRADAPTGEASRPPVPVVRERPRREKRPRHRFVTDIDVRRPPEPAKAQGARPRVVTDIDVTLPGGR